MTDIIINSLALLKYDALLFMMREPYALLLNVCVCVWGGGGGGSTIKFYNVWGRVLPLVALI